MKTTIYWIGQRLRRAAHEFRFNAKLWWLNQQVEFLDWRVTMEALLSSSPFTAAPQPIKQGGRRAMQSLSRERPVLFQHPRRRSHAVR